MADDERPYLVMEWVDGRTLGEWIHGSTVNPADCLNVFAQICEAVAFAHRSLVVHGDIKPANVAVTRDGQVKLLDFGVAQLLDVDTDARMPSALTPGFAAPEQLAGEPGVDRQRYLQLGCCAALAGLPPGSRASGASGAVAPGLVRLSASQ